MAAVGHGGATRFDELLERALANEAQTPTPNQTSTANPKPKRTFLRKGARGWWMQQPAAKTKMMRHVLDSGANDDDAHPNQKQPQRQNQNPRQKHQNQAAEAKEAISTRDVDGPSDTNTDPTSLGMRMSMGMSMSGVRQSYAAKLARDADELADFEALEQALAGASNDDGREEEEEEEEEEVISTRDYGTFAEAADFSIDFGDCTRQSLAGHSVDGEVESELGGESAMIFEPDPNLFEEDSESEPAPRRRSRAPFRPSELSAVSFNDSEPWAESSIVEFFARHPHSPIATSEREVDEGVTPEQRRGDVVSDEEETSSYTYQRKLATPSADLSQGLEMHPYFMTSDAVHERLERSNHSSVASARRLRSSHGSANSSNGSRKREQVGRRNTDRLTTDTKMDETRETGAARGLDVLDDPRPTTPKEQLATGSLLPVSIEEKLLELEEEVRHYKTETLQLQKMKKQFEDECRRLASEKEELRLFEAEQRRLIEDEWEDARRKMTKEERLFAREMKLKLSSAGAVQSRKDREEIESLKAQIVKLQLEARQSSSRMKATNDALRQRIVELEGRNRELAEEMKFIEKDRLRQWEKQEKLMTSMDQSSSVHIGPKAERSNGSTPALGAAVHDLLSRWTQPETESSPVDTATRIFHPPSESGFEQNDDAYNPTRYSTGSGSAESDRTGASLVSTKKGNVSRSESTKRKVVEEVAHRGGKKEITYSDGRKVIVFADGNVKEIDQDGNIVIRFTNGDRKEYSPDTGITVYHYHDANTRLTTYPDKTKVYEFPNQQVETTYPDGSTEILFADGIKKSIRANGDEFSEFPDGTTMLECKDGLREVTLANRRRIRYYPDGKMTWLSGGVETQVRSDAELKQLMENL